MALDFLFGASSSNRITKSEFTKKIKRILRKRGWSDMDIDDVERVVQRDFDAGSANTSAITKSEFKDRMEWFREHKSEHRLDNAQIEELEEIMQEFLE